MYIIIEIQKAADGTISTLVTQKNTRNEADSVYYQTLAAAALSGLPSHAAVLMTASGEALLYGCYTHTTEG